MRIRNPTAKLMGALCLVSVMANADEPMRCGSSFVTSQDSVATLLAKCGEPATKESRTDDTYNYNSNTGRRAKVGKTTIETWTYRSSRGAIPRVVKIINGKIKSIEAQP